MCAEPIMKNKPHGYWLFLIIGEIGSIIMAFLFICMLYFSLPPTDGAYGIGIINMLKDPFLHMAAVYISALSGIAASVLLYFCLRYSRLMMLLGIIFGAVILTIVVVTPIAGIIAWPCTYFALVSASLACKGKPWRIQFKEAP